MIKLLLILNQTQTPKSVYINPAFNQIQRPSMTKQASPSSQLDYVFDTVEGQPVTATLTAQVFKIPEISPNFSYLTKIYLIAKNMGFDINQIKHTKTGNEVEFSDNMQKLSIDITNYNFTYNYQFDQDPSLFSSGSAVLQGSDAEQKATDFLKLVDRYPEELAQGKTNLIYFFYDPQTKQMAQLENAENANLVEVDFFRPDIGDIPMVSSLYLNSQNYIVMKPNVDTTYKILRAQIRFFEKSDQQVGIYPLISADEAFTDLKAEKAMFINLPANTNQITIKKMFLGYFDSDTYQPYLQPVYVFWGNDDFAAYVPAIKPEYYLD